MLKGQRFAGLPGYTGANGLQGDTGATGWTGATGPRGSFRITRQSCSPGPTH